MWKSVSVLDKWNFVSPWKCFWSIAGTVVLLQVLSSHRLALLGEDYMFLLCLQGKILHIYNGSQVILSI